MKQYFIVFFAFVAVGSSLEAKRAAVAPDFAFLNQFLTSQQTNGDKLCSVCQKMMSFFDSFLTNPKYQTDIANGLATFCDKITDQKQQQVCKNLLTKDFPMVMNVMSNLISPTTMCVKLFKMCPDTSKPVLVDTSNPYKNASENAMVCAACFTGFGFVRDAFMNEDFGNFCIEYIQPVCDSIQDAEKKSKVREIVMCLDTVTKFVGMIINVLHDALDPQTLCTKEIGPVVDACKQQSSLNAFLP